MDIQTIRNLRQLVRCRLALPGLAHYLFCQGLERLELRQASPEGLGLKGWPVLSLSDETTVHPELLLLVPATWCAGLVTQASLPAPEALVSCTSEAQAPTIWQNPQSQACRSILSRQLQEYFQALQHCHTPEDLLSLLQQEQILRRLFTERLWASFCHRPPVTALISQVWQRHHGVHLAASFHLLPQAEQMLWLRYWIDQMDGHYQKPELREDGLELASWLLGSVNTRELSILDAAAQLRKLAIHVASTLTNPVSKAQTLMRLIDTATREASPEVIEELATSVDWIVITIRDRPAECEHQSRLRREDLQQVIKAAATNLSLLQALLMRLGTRSTRLLPGLLDLESGRMLMQALLLIKTADVYGQERDINRLVHLFENLLPKLWWKGAQIHVLLHQLRRFRTDLTWLLERSTLLKTLTRLYSNGRLPAEVVQSAADPLSLSGSLKAQLLWLAWFVTDAQQKRHLFQQVDGLRNSTQDIQLGTNDEERILEAVLCGQDAIATSHLRLLASQRGVEDLLPLPSIDWRTSKESSLTRRFRCCLNQWRSAYPVSESISCAPVCVVITTFNPEINLLGMAIESLLYQIQAPSEIMIIDDGSRLPVRSRVETLLENHSFHRTKLIWIRNQQNMGQYVCRNFAVSQSSQPYLAIQDDDDISHPLRFKYQWECAQTGFLANYCAHIRLSADTGFLQADGGSTGFLGDGIATLFIDRHTVQRMGGFYPVRSRGDVEFRSRLLHTYGHGCMHHSNRPLYIMRGSSSTISSTYEYGCSLSLATWRHLIKKRLLQ